VPVNLFVYSQFLCLLYSTISNSLHDYPRKLKIITNKRSNELISEDVLTKEIESWKGFADSLRAEDNILFAKMLNDIYKYVAAINAKGRPFSTEPLLMALLLEQQKMIEQLIDQVKHLTEKVVKSSD
jgi:hypothetical protein